MNHRIFPSIVVCLPLFLGCSGRPAATVVVNEPERKAALLEHLFPHTKNGMSPLASTQPGSELPPDVSAGKFENMPKPEFGNGLPSDLPPLHSLPSPGSSPGDALPGTMLPPPPANPMNLPGSPMTGGHPAPAVPVTPGVGPNLSGAPPLGTMLPIGPLAQPQQPGSSPMTPPTIPGLPARE